MATIDSLTLKGTPLGSDTIELNDGQKCTLGSLPVSTAQTAAFVGLTGNQTIAGVKTFSSPPVAGGVQLSTTSIPASAIAQIRWNDTDKCAEFETDGGVVVQIGQETLIYARNASGVNEPNGSAVILTGASGQRATVALARADTLEGCRSTIGLVTTSAGIADSSFGFVTIHGLVRDLDTSAFSEGAELWLSPTTAGAYTITKPSAEGQFVVRIGFVVRSHATQGSIFVAPHYHGSVTGDAVMNSVSKAVARTAIDAAAADLSGAAQQDALYLHSPRTLIASTKGGPTASAIHSGYQAATTRIRHVAPYPIHRLRYVYAGTYNLTNMGETRMPNAIEVAASVEVLDAGAPNTAAVIPVFFNGKRMALLQPGAILVSDALDIRINGDEAWFSRTFQSRLASTAYTYANGEVGLLPVAGAQLIANNVARGRSYINNNGESWTRTTTGGADPTSVEATMAAAGALSGGTDPIVALVPTVLAEFIDPDVPATLIVGTSITRGQGDGWQDDAGNTGWASRLCNEQNIPAANLAAGSESCLNSILSRQNYATRGVFTKWGRFVLFDHGRNDLTTGISLATLQARMIAAAEVFTSQGLKVIACTVTPYTLSADIWVSDQTVTTADEQRLALNDWLRTVPAPFFGCIDPAAAVQDSENPALWRASELVLSGTTTAGAGGSLTDSGAAWTNGQWSGYVVKNLTTGGHGFILGNSATQIFISTLTGANFGIGDGYEIYDALTYDGLHPTGLGHKAMATATGAAFAALVGA